MSYELAAAKRRIGLPKRRIDHTEHEHEESRGLLAGASEADDDVEVVQLDYPHKLKAVAILLVGVALAAVGYVKHASPSKRVEVRHAPFGPIPQAQGMNHKQLQIANYIDGTALLFGVHIVHHGGTSVCSLMEKIGPTPGFACAQPGKHEGDNRDWPKGMPITVGRSWPYKKTATYADRLRELFHFVSSGDYQSFGALQRTNWESDNLASLIVMRHPLERFLSGGLEGKCGDFHDGKPMALTSDPTNETQALYWEYANSECADNFALRVLANNSHCVNGAETTLACLESAKTLLKRFTFILDQACLSESMVELGRRLHLNITEQDFVEASRNRNHKLDRPASIRERLGNDTLYEYLQERFRRDISLYEWSKKHSVVQCKQEAYKVPAPTPTNDNTTKKGAEVDPVKETVPIPQPQPSPLPLSANKQLQIDNYINGTALILSVHITHHAGTSVCSMMKKLGPVPGFACMGKGKDDDAPWPEGIPAHLKSWPYNDTATYTEKFRAFFHYKGQEYRSWGNLHRTNWEYKNLVSMIVMRDPLERFLAGGKCGGFHSNKNTPLSINGDPTNATQAQYWEYANSGCADNYALRVLANESHCVNGAETTLACLESAKDLLRRFTFILDQSCLSDSMAAMGRYLHLNITEQDFESRLHHKHPPTVRERLGNDTLYEYLQERFRRDIALYEWSKTQSVVQCDKLSQ